MRATINGKLVNIPDNTLAKDLNNYVESVQPGDTIFQQTSTGSKPLSSDEIIQENSRFDSSPDITKG